MGLSKARKTNARSNDGNKDLPSRLSVVEEICMLTAPQWNWKKMTRWMTIMEACNHVGISDMTFRNWRQEDKKLHDYYESTKRARKEMAHSSMRDLAMNNVFNAISWQVKLRPKEMVEVSLRYLEKTDESFNQSIKVDVDSSSKVQISMGTEEMTQRIMELSAALWITNPTNDEWNKYASDTHATDSQESTSDSEISSPSSGGGD